MGVLAELIFAIAFEGLAGVFEWTFVKVFEAPFRWLERQFLGPDRF